MVQARIRDVKSQTCSVFQIDEEQDFSGSKIYCANCINCKLIPEVQEGKTRYVLRIRCAAGKWKKKLGEEKIYKYCTINRRYQDFCDSYDDMGETKTFLRELKKDLPNKDELYVIAEEE
ncbi:MAG: hypothetical protein LBV20_02810 [Treponema sp.]|jgi:hypothetical protein|nr:hypothetical protein [Treponema sp.]